MAVELMVKMVEDTPKDLTFISTWCLPYGGVLYELNLPEMVAWFNTPQTEVASSSTSDLPHLQKEVGNSQSTKRRC
jgi:hypothetical protein